MRHGAVQAHIIAKGEVPLGRALHDDQPTLRSDFDSDAVLGAVPLHGIDKSPLAFEHF
jgi:hypothetical protein